MGLAPHSQGPSTRVSSLHTYPFAASDLDNSACTARPNTDLTPARETFLLNATTNCQCKYPLVAPDSFWPRIHTTVGGNSPHRKTNRSGTDSQERVHSQKMPCLRMVFAFFLDFSWGDFTLYIYSVAFCHIFSKTPHTRHTHSNSSAGGSGRYKPH